MRGSLSARALTGAAGILLSVCGIEASFAQPCPAGAVAAAGGSKPALVAESNGSWIKINGKRLDPSITRFAYVGRRTQSREGSEGALAVRFSRALPTGSARGDQGPAKVVTMRRPFARTTCGSGSWFILLPRDYTVAQAADVDDFIQYHLLTTSDSNVIRNYHIRYRSPTSGCIRTDDAARNRRTAFLVETDGPPTRTASAVREEAAPILKQIVGLFGSPAVASTSQEAPGTAPQSSNKKKTAVREAYANEKKAFAGFAAVESQIYTYPLGGRACALFAVPDSLGTRSGATWSVDVVDLDGDETGRGRHQAFTFTWQ